MTSTYPVVRRQPRRRALRRRRVDVKSGFASLTAAALVLVLTAAVLLLQLSERVHRPMSFSVAVAAAAEAPSVVSSSESANDGNVAGNASNEQEGTAEVCKNPDSGRESCSASAEQERDDDNDDVGATIDGTIGSGIDLTLSSYGEVQTFTSEIERSDEPHHVDLRRKTAELRIRVDEYMRNTVLRDDDGGDGDGGGSAGAAVYDEHVRKECKNRHQHCSYWATIGECDNNPGYMHLSCAPSCFTCHKLDFDVRCAYNPSDLPPDTWQPGDLDRCFQRIVENPKYNSSITILSKPGDEEQITDEVWDHKLKKVLKLSRSSEKYKAPWIVTIDNFLSEQECQTLIELGMELGYERSADVGQKRKFDGTYESNVNDGRTSSQAWCHDHCRMNTTTEQITQRIEALIGVPEINFESLQLLRYYESQHYHEHHDYIWHQRNHKQGPRILTVFLYLNDEGLEGGGTRFDLLDLTVEPKRGRALIWPSVLNSNPTERDFTTHHEALPVRSGVKYAANAWVHLRDFQSPYKENCI